MPANLPLRHRSFPQHVYLTVGGKAAEDDITNALQRLQQLCITAVSGPWSRRGRILSATPTTIS